MAKLAAKKKVQSMQNDSSSKSCDKVNYSTETSSSNPINVSIGNQPTHVFSTGKGNSVAISKDKIHQATLKYGLNNVDNN